MRQTTLNRSLTFAAFAALVGSFLWLAGGTRAGDDPNVPPPDKLEKKPGAAEQKQPDPPDTLEKKPKPPDPSKSRDKNADDKGSSLPKKLNRPDDAADRNSGPPEDPEKLKERIARDMQSAEQKLKAHDPGSETRQFQERALENLDKLLDLIRNPPQSQQQQQQQRQQQSKGQMQGRPKGGQQGQKQTQSLTRRQQRDQARRQREQMARGQQQNGQQPQDQQLNPQGNGQNPPIQGGFSSVGKADKLSDVVKDIWGHLPETLRQEVDHYYRDQFMPRYRELLQQYYSRLAEQERRVRDDR